MAQSDYLRAENACARATCVLRVARIGAALVLKRAKGGILVPTEFRIVLQGCDDATEVTLALTADELAVVQRLASAVATASESDCQPKIEVVA